MQYILYFSLLISLALGAFNRIQLSNAIAINLSDLIAPSFLIYSFIKCHPLNQKFLKIYATWVTILLGIFLASLIPHIASTPTNELVIGALYPIRWYIYFLLPLALIPFFQKTKRADKDLSITFLIISILGLLQFLIIPNLQILESVGYDPHYYRLVSTWLDPNFLGAALIFALLITYKNLDKKPLSILILIILFTAFILTFSRSAYIMFGIAFTLYALLTRSIQTLAFLLASCAIIASIYLFPRTAIDTSRNIDRSFSANLRLMSYGLAAEMFRDNPLMGAGFNLIRYEKRERGKILDVRDGGNSGAGIDSSWLFILATTGIMGMIVFVSFWTRLVYFAIDPHITKSKPFQVLTHFLKHPSTNQAALVSLLLAWSVHAWFINSLFYIPLIIVWTIIFSSITAKTLTRL